MVPLRPDHSSAALDARLLSFLVGQDGEGHWLAVETHGLGGGIFITRDAALNYALGETGRRPGAVTSTAQPIVLR